MNSDDQIKKIPKKHSPTPKQESYQKLNFSDDMQYQQRSMLRTQCMRFIRFAYYIDFLTLSTLKYIYDNSLINFYQELQRISRNNHPTYVYAQKKQSIKSDPPPVFKVNLIFIQQDVPIDRIDKIQHFQNPERTHKIQEFRILGHVYLKKIKKKINNQQQNIQSTYNQLQQQKQQQYQKAPDLLDLPQPPLNNLTNIYLKLQPSSQNIYLQITNILNDGLDILQCFQRWSKSNDIKIYSDVLQQWDDRVGQDSLATDNFLHPDQWIDSQQNQKIRNGIKQIIDRNFKEIQQQNKKIYQKYLLIYWQNLHIKQQYFTNPLLAEPIETIQNSIQVLIHQKQQLQKKLPILYQLKLLKIDSKNPKNMLTLSKQKSPLQKLYKNMPGYLTSIFNQVFQWCKINIQKLNNTTQSVQQFVNIVRTLKSIQKRQLNMKQKYSFIGQMYTILDSNKQSVIIDDKDMLINIKKHYTTLLTQISNLQSQKTKVQQARQKNIIKFSQQVVKIIIPNLNKQISKFQNLINQKKFLQLKIGMNNAIQQLQKYDKQLRLIQKNVQNCKGYQFTLGMPQTRFDNLIDLRINLNLKLQLWKGLKSFTQYTNIWKEQKFQLIDVQFIKSIIQKYTKTVNKCNKKLTPNPVLDKFKEQLNTFKDTMPVVIALSTDSVKNNLQYWQQIQKLSQLKFTPESQIKLKEIMDQNLHYYQQQIIQICTQAKQQKILNQQIKNNTDRFYQLQFTLKQYKPDNSKNVDCYILDKVQDLYAQLDQLLANMSNILGNRYLKKQRNIAQNLNKAINNCQQFIDDFLIVQKNWIYLQNIFSSKDIKIKLRQQNSKFEGIDKQFKIFMKGVNRNKFVKNISQKIHKQWIKNKDQLSQIQKQLQKYLQDKRNDFPRFYFLSNDQLIQILAKANQFQSFQKNIRKCFQCISKVTLNQAMVIQNVISLQDQKLNLIGIDNRNMKFGKIQIQILLKTLENCINYTLRNRLNRILMQQNNQNIKNRNLFIQSNVQSQVILLYCQTQWTSLTQGCIQSNSLEKGLQTVIRQLSDLTNLIRNPNLNHIKRKTFISLITQQVHNRDVMQSLLQVQSIVLQDFAWAQQLRFYNTRDNIIQQNQLAQFQNNKGKPQSNFLTFYVRQIDSIIQYGYQYLGVMSRLVITPLTDRCWMTIIGAMQMHLGAAPAGPAGTGKTQSTKDLAKGLGMLCVVFNCSQQIQYKIMGRLFSGLSQQGAWSCLDQFNRIDIQVLSVIAQQLLQIRYAKLQGLSQFYFIDRNIKLQKSCGVFITMNPGYAGRTQLPDNLKVLFRSVSMMIPNYRLIAQIMLFAQGFDQAKNLSKKMVQLYKLSSQQLSQQDHYDFGMRAVKSVLVMAGQMKRKSLMQSQQKVLIRAMRNSNIPKFLKQDLPLFQALISDLFPHVIMQNQKNIQLQIAIKKSCKQLGYKQVPELIQKVIQLYQTFNVRFGVMIVGQATSGKTSCYKILSHAMTQLKKQQLINNSIKQQQYSPIKSQYKIIKQNYLNPKSISMGQLYGQINQLTQQWSDGLASKIMRQAVLQQDNNISNWVVFDGPVDALWIQNMNTVLDDNMMLCLANGQRIKLLPTMKMLFQVMDLKTASPATVSRCGMVYMIVQDLGWMPMAQIWLQRWLQKMIIDPQEQQFWKSDIYILIKNLLNKSIDSIYNFINKNKLQQYQPIKTLPLQLAKSLLNLFQIFCSKQYGFRPQISEKQYKKKFVIYSFGYAYIWALCVTTYQKYHDKLSAQFRATFNQIIVPGNDNVQNYYFDPKQVQMRKWNQKLNPFVYDSNQSFHQIIVQTIDTIRYSQIIKKLIIKKNPILITGISGTGKSIHLSKITHSPLVLTSTTSHQMLQLSIQSKLQKLKKNLIGTVNGNYIIVAIDDTNMPAQQQYGAIPPIQVLRTFIDKNGIWDRKQKFWKKIQNTSFICACSPPGSGRNQLTPRFTRHFNILCLPQPSSQSLKRIFGSIIDGFFSKNAFYQSVRKNSSNLIQATYQIYNLIKKQKLPIPSKFHYTFNLRDFSKIIQGIMRGNQKTIRDVQVLGKIWVHQVKRVIGDRLNCSQDIQWLQNNLYQYLQKYFRVRTKQNNFFFSNILRINQNSKQYQQINDLNKVIDILNQQIINQNYGSNKIIFFEDAVKNILKIHRILSMQRGNGLLIGVSGCGKKTLTKLCCTLNEHQICQIQITKGFNLQSFRQFIKDLMKKCSIQQKKCTFLFTDNQIISQQFLQDINNLLNSGQIPNLWQIQDLDNIINLTREYNQKKKRSGDKQTIYRTFVQKVRQNLHIVLSMSPIGDSLRIRSRKFPALINCCTINWFFRWPQSSLISVSYAILDSYQNFPISKGMGRQKIISIFSKLAMQIHISAQQQALKFQQQLKRKVYTTPKSFLDMLKLYLKLLQQKQIQIMQKRDRLNLGLYKLQSASIQVTDLQKKLHHLKPQLQQQNILLQQAIIKINKDNEQAQLIQSNISLQAKIVNDKKQQIQILTNDAKQVLKQVQPILQNAKLQVQKIKKQSITNLSTMNSPPTSAKFVFQGVCIFLDQKYQWKLVRSMLSKVSEFIVRLKSTKKVTDQQILKLRRLFSKPQFSQQSVKANKQLYQIYQWLKALQKYSIVYKQVQPKKIKMKQLQQQLNKANQLLQQKIKILNNAKQKVQNLRIQTDRMINKKKQLQIQLQLTHDRLIRSKQLIRLTSQQSIRWKQTVQSMKDSMQSIPADIFLCSSAISYNGPFSGNYRKKLIQYWISLINSQQLTLTTQFSIPKILSNSLQIRDWNINYLPSDTVSLQNAIFIQKGNRWPLMIDPQNQASKWLSSFISKNQKHQTKLSNQNFISDMKNAIQNGKSILVNEVDQILPAIMDSIFAKQITIKDQLNCVKFGQQQIYYDKKFKLYMFTKLSNPTFLPQVFIRVNVINFTVTFQGLLQQLLSIVVKHQSPIIQKQKDDNVVKMSQYTRKIDENQKIILQLLSNAQTQTILDNIQLINTLKTSQQAAKQITIKIVQSQILQKSIQQERSQYQVVSIRGTVLFFLIKDLSLLQGMYQYSLQYIIKIFMNAMDSVPQDVNLSKRILSLIQQITQSVYKNVIRGLFQKDKKIFSFLISTSIARQSLQISSDLWNCFIRGPPSNYIAPYNQNKNISQKKWKLISYLQSNFPQFSSLTTAFLKQKALLQLQSKLFLFDRFMLDRVIRPEKIINSMNTYVQNTLGNKYLQSVDTSIKDLYNDSDSSTPIIFILSPGADPTSGLYKFKQQYNKSNSLKIQLQSISLGQGQGKSASQMINRGKISGKWILLQNCHLAKTFMPDLQKIVQENINKSQQINKQFRLFLTSMPANYFPASILQNGIKLTTQPPKGIKSNLKRSWNQISNQQLQISSQKSQSYHKLLWGLTFFHSIIQQRQKFGPLGWNIKYQFNQSDLETSKLVLKNMLNKQQNLIPYQALLYVIGQINYGGRVTDDWDRRLLLTILRKFCNPYVISQSKYKFSNDTQYYIPQYKINGLQDYKAYIQSLPLVEDSLIFNMNQNANTNYLLMQQKNIMETLQLMQPRQKTLGGKSSQQIILQLLNSLLQQNSNQSLLPPQIQKWIPHKSLFQKNHKNLISSMSIFLIQEMQRFSILIKVIKNTLKDLRSAIKGFILMSDQLDCMFYDLLINKVPKNWSKVGYPSLKPLASWMKDLKQRLYFLKQWYQQGSVISYWLSAFFFPQGFLTGVLQQYARTPDKQIPIDQLLFTFKFTQFTKQTTNTKPIQGIYINGLILQGGSWDIKKKILVQPSKKQLYCMMPLINFIPIRNDQKRYSDKYQTYECPVYKTSVRAGVLSTTGQSTNFVVTVQLLSIQDSDNWILQGTALLLQLNQ